MKKTMIVLLIFLLVAVFSFSSDDFSLSVFGVGKYTNVDNVGNIGLYANTPSYEFTPNNTVYIGASQISTQITSASFSLYLNDSQTPISGYSNIPLSDNGIAPDIIANDGVFMYSLDLSSISSLKHNDFITVKVSANFSDGQTVNRSVRFLIDSTFNFNTYKVGDVRNAVFNAEENLKVNLLNYNPIALNTDNEDAINNITISQIGSTFNTLSFSNIKRNSFFVKIAGPDEQSDAASLPLPTYAATYLSVANLNAVKYSYSGAWSEIITSGTQSYVRKDFIKYLGFKADKPANWWKITAYGQCASPTSPPSTMTFRLIDSNDTTLASFTGPAQSKDVELSGNGVTARISVDDPSKLATKTETTMLYIEEFSENIILDFKPHIYGVSVSQNPTYDKDSVKISFYNDFTGSADFIVYNDAGKKIYSASKNVKISKTASDLQYFIWDFKDSDGNRAPSGKNYYFKIIPLVVDTSSGQTIYGRFVYGSIFLKLPIGSITGISPKILKTNSELNYTYKISEPATVMVSLSRNNESYYSSKIKINQEGNYKSSLTIPSSATDGAYKFQFDAFTKNFDTKSSTTIYIDNTPPVVSFSLTQMGSSVIVSGTTDVNSAGINIEYKLYSSSENGKELIKTSTETITDGKIYKVFDKLKEGYYIVEITSKDPAGNHKSLEKGIALGPNNVVVLTIGSTITTQDGVLTISIPASAVSSDYMVSITSKSSGTDMLYTFNPAISLTKYATLTINLPEAPEESDYKVISTFNGTRNLMLKLTAKKTCAKIKDIQNIEIKSVPNAKVLQVDFDKIITSNQMKIKINNYENVKLSIYVLDLSGELVKYVEQNLSLQPGYHEINWDLTNRFNSRVPNGQYILYIISDKGNIAKLFGVKR